MQPIGEEHCWKDLNFYENDFTDELGSLLTDSKNVDVDANYSKFSPASSLNGEMKKKWVIENGIRYLMKVNANDYGQQSINEVIASKLHEKLGWDNYVQYRVDILGNSFFHNIIFRSTAVPADKNLFGFPYRLYN